LASTESGLEAWPGVHVSIVSVHFVIVVASTGVLATTQAPGPVWLIRDLGGRA